MLDIHSYLYSPFYVFFCIFVFQREVFAAFWPSSFDFAWTCMALAAFARQLGARLVAFAHISNSLQRINVKPNCPENRCALGTRIMLCKPTAWSWHSGKCKLLTGELACAMRCNMGQAANLYDFFDGNWDDKISIVCLLLGCSDGSGSRKLVRRWMFVFHFHKTTCQTLRGYGAPSAVSERLTRTALIYVQCLQ